MGCCRGALCVLCWVALVFYLEERALVPPFPSPSLLAPPIFLCTCLALSYIAFPYLILSCLVLSCLVLSGLVLSCLVLSCLVVSGLVGSCLVLSLSCLALSLSSSCLVSFILIIILLLFFLYPHLPLSTTMSSFLDDEEELFVYALLGRLLHQQHLLSDIMNVDSEIRRLKRRKRVHNTRHNREHGLDWMDGWIATKRIQKRLSTLHFNLYRNLH